MAGVEGRHLAIVSSFHRVLQFPKGKRKRNASNVERSEMPKN